MSQTTVIPHTKRGRPRTGSLWSQVDEASYRRALRASKRAAQAIPQIAATSSEPGPSQAEQKAEWRKCAEDIEYFFETYIKIVNADGELVEFHPYPWQSTFIDAYRAQRRIIGLCARQAGKSQATTCLALHHCLFSDWKTCAITANKSLTSHELIRRARRSYGLLPAWMQRRCALVRDNTMAMSFANGSRIFGAATSPTSISGQSVTLLIVDEAAKIENWKVFWPSTSQTISQSKTAKVIMLSTPFGLNHFHDYVKGSPANGWHLIAVPWSEVPGRDGEWKRQTIATDFNGDVEAFRAEHELSFTSSGRLLLDGATLDWMEANLKEPISAEYL